MWLEPQSKEGLFPVTIECVFKSQWAAITSKYLAKALQWFPHIVTLLQWKLFALRHFHVKISHASFGSVKNTNPVYTLSFYKTVIFFRPMLLMLNILIFLPIWGWKYSCIILRFLKCRFRFSMYWVINVPFIELLLALSIWLYFSGAVFFFYKFACLFFRLEKGIIITVKLKKYNCILLADFQHTNYIPLKISASDLFLYNILKISQFSVSIFL